MNLRKYQYHRVTICDDMAWQQKFPRLAFCTRSEKKNEYKLNLLSQMKRDDESEIEFPISLHSLYVGPRSRFTEYPLNRTNHPSTCICAGRMDGSQSNISQLVFHRKQKQQQTQKQSYYTPAGVSANSNQLGKSLSPIIT